MQLDFARKRDLIAGVVIALCGVGAILGALDYGLGTLRRMGPGLFPNVLGVLMIAVGLIIAQRAVFAAHEAGEEEAEAFTPPDLRGGLFILAGAVAFSAWRTMADSFRRHSPACSSPPWAIATIRSRARRHWRWA